MRLLIVEDEKELCDTVAKTLYHAGYEIDTCYDGSEALDYILAERSQIKLKGWMPVQMTIWKSHFIYKN